MRNPAAFYRRCRRRFGDVFTVPGADGTVVTTTDPELARLVLRAPHDVLGESVDLTEPALGPGSVFLLRGEEAARERKLLMPLFHGRRMREYTDLIWEVAEAHCGRWETKRPVVMREAVNLISLEIILRCVIGIDRDERVDEGSRLITGYVDTFSPTMLYFEGLRGAANPLWRRFVAAREALRSFLREEIRSKRASERTGHDILSILIDARYEDGSAMDDEWMIDELVTLLLAGHETTSIGMTWALYWLDRHPEVLARVRAELAGVPADAGREAFAGLPWLDATCKESLRLHPIASRITRKVLSQPFRLGRWVVPPGLAVGVSITGIHEREDLFENAREFRPQRFLERTYGPHEYMPFGGGVRRCLGAAFADYEMRLVLACIISRFQFRAVSTKEVKPVRRSVTMGPKGDVPMWLTPLGAS